MKLNLKRVVEPTEQLNLRIPASLKKRIDNSRERATHLGIDYNATLIANLEEFQTAFEEQVTTQERTSTKSASTSLAEPKHPKPEPASSNGAPTTPRP